MKRKAITNLVLAGLILAPTSLQAHAATSDGWVNKGYSWQYYKHGTPVKGWTFDNGSWYYLGQDGNMKTGWANAGNTWYYLDASGAMKTGWLKDGNVWYFLDSSGAMKTGWANVGGTWYYLNPNGAMKTGWAKEGNTWYYLESSGAMRTGWVADGGAWYFLEGSGAMKTGWVNDGNVWYLLDSSGAMKTGWANVGGTWYYLNPSGAMKTGWVAIGGAWYYLDSSGAMKTGWVKDNNKWYYLEGNGAWNPNRVYQDSKPSTGDTTDKNLKALPGYTLPSGNYVYPMNMDKLNTVNMTNTWDMNTKMSQMKNLANTLGVGFDGGSKESALVLTQIKNDVNLESTYITLGFNKSNKLSISYSGVTGIRSEEAKKVIKSLLKPYLPTSYNSVVDKYFNEHYVGGGNYMDAPEKHDGLSVDMYAGVIEISK